MPARRAGAAPARSPSALPRSAAIRRGVGRPADRGIRASVLRSRAVRLRPAATARTSGATPTTVSRPAAPSWRLDDPVTKLPKVGTGVAKKLANLGVATVGDLVELKPRRHVDYSRTLQISRVFDVQPGDDVTVRGEVIDIQEIQGRGKPRSEARIADRSGSIRVTWFTPYVARQVHSGDQIALHGAPDFGYGRISFTSPDWEKIADGGAIAEGRIAPVYPLTEGISQKFLRGLTKLAVEGALAQVDDWLPETVRTRLGAGDDGPLPALPDALAHVHFPRNAADLERAQRRLAFNDLFLLQIGLVRRKRRRQAFGGIPLPVHPALLRRLRVSLPFRLTGAQDSALDEILTDLAVARPMSRLLQGDVGSGKTVVAAAAMLVAHANGRQSAMMAPTEILAEQHFHNLRGLYHGLPDADRPRVALLTGSTRAAERRETLAAVEAGEIDILVGTHALIQDTVAFAALGLSVVDEQHRFGVRQRSTLPDKASGAVPHQLAMTATPIPRTLNMVLNGDLDVSIIAERPPGRLPIETRRFFGDERDEAYALVRQEVAAGRQVFVICPLVEASDAIEAKAAVDEAARLKRDVFPDLEIATLHGRMSGRDKDRIMTGFRDRDYHILVSTSVIEVGVDVPNATVTVIQEADCFGLAQLHQLRGRVGRGAEQSYCLL
ncbi:MAG TPA: ATP-dependent DNA helicase RecG, partial [Thermomicrobiales bacterium]|nr:ATP-dependent DNA helicase RecG [Thermomicrobiales bacterium]